MLKVFLVVLFILSGCVSTKAYSPKYNKLTEFFDYISEKEKAMGEASIIKGGKEVYSKKYEFLKQPRDPIYRIGSISKVYTAVMVLKLVESGKLTLSTNLSKFYPQMPNAKIITIKHLLQHRSGLVNFTSTPSYFEFHEKPQTEKNLVELFVKNGVGFKPGAKYDYSNTGYVMLSFILEKIHSVPFSEVLLNEISKPLGLKDTFVHDSDAPTRREVPSYKKAAKWVLDTNTHQTVPMGAGAIASTAKEVGLFLWSLFNGKILKPDTVAQMKNIVEGYGLGLIRVPFNDKKGFGHTGGIDGFRSIGFHFSDKDTVVVNLANAMAMKMNDISIAMLSSIYGLDFKIPEFKDELQLPIEILKKYEGLYKASGFPIDLNVFETDGALFVQGTGQPAIPLTAVKENTFIHVGAGIELVFNSANDEMVLTQGGKSNTLMR